MAPAVAANHQDPMAWEIVFFHLFVCFLHYHLVVDSATANLFLQSYVLLFTQKKYIAAGRQNCHLEIDLDWVG